MELFKSPGASRGFYYVSKDDMILPVSTQNRYSMRTMNGVVRWIRRNYKDAKVTMTANGDGVHVVMPLNATDAGWVHVYDEVYLDLREHENVKHVFGVFCVGQPGVPNYIQFFPVFYRS